LCRVARIRCTWRRRNTSGYTACASPKEIELTEISTAVPFARTLEVGLESRDDQGGVLPIVANLTTADECGRVRLVGETKAGSDLAGDPGLGPENRCAIDVGFNSAKAGTGIHASVPTGPVIDGRGRRRCRLDGYISRESGTAPGKDESGPEQTGRALAHKNPPWPAKAAGVRLNLVMRIVHYGDFQPVLLCSHAQENVRFTRKSGHHRRQGRSGRRTFAFAPQCLFTHVCRRAIRLLQESEACPCYDEMRTSRATPASIMTQSSAANEATATAGNLRINGAPSSHW